MQISELNKLTLDSQISLLYRAQTEHSQKCGVTFTECVDRQLKVYNSQMEQNMILEELAESKAEIHKETYRWMQQIIIKLKYYYYRIIFFILGCV